MGNRIKNAVLSSTTKFKIMKTFELNGVIREKLGKKDTKKVRKEAAVPCVLYGGEKTVHFTVKATDVRNLIYTPHVYFVKLTIGDKTQTSILQDLQFHPVTDLLLHIDFLEVSETEPVSVQIPVILEGLAKGVQEGGQLQLSTRRLKVKGKSADLPDNFVINVDDIALGQSIKVGDLSYDNIELLDPKDLVITAVKLTRAAKGELDGEEEGEEGSEEGSEEGAEEGVEETKKEGKKEGKK